MVLPQFEKTLKDILEFEPLDFISEGLPIFCPRKESDQTSDKYDKDWAIINRYTGLAYGFKSSLWGGDPGIGGAEGLYRTVDSFMSLSLLRGVEQVILDLGCGVGRTIYDCAPLHPNSLFVGMDFAYKMCIRAKEILVDGSSVSLDGPEKDKIDDGWAGRGYPALIFDDSLTLDNVKILQGSATKLPFKPASFDCVVSTLLLDRVRDSDFAPADDVVRTVAEIARVLKPGGRLILSTPLNFSRLADWSRFKNSAGTVVLLEENGFHIEEKFDGLVYRELEDARGSYQDWLVFFAWARRDKI
jgi:SAM-dependent methyltransferase